MNNRLKELGVYLCGPIDRVPDSGRGWRDNITPFLQDLGVNVFDPLRKPIDIGIEDDDARKERRHLRQFREWNELSRLMRLVRLADLRMVDKSDFLIVNVDMEVPMMGTWEELFLANRQKKPVIVHCPQGKEAIGDWLFGVCPHELFFSSWEAVRSYLWHVHTAPEVNHLKRWLFFKPSEN